MPHLISIEIENYRSFYSRQELNIGGQKNRRVTAIFGPNAGGKSNTARALALIQAIITDSTNANWVLPYEPFLLREGADKEPTYFALIFEHLGRRYEYRFSYVSDRIVFEELTEQSENTKKMRTIFRRLSDGSLSASAYKYGFGVKLAKKTRKESLIITKAREDNNEYANLVFELVNSLIVILGDMRDMHPYTLELLKHNSQVKKRTVKLMQYCDLAIRDIEITDVQVTDEMLRLLPLPDEAKKTLISATATSIQTAHVIRNAERTVVGTRLFDFWNHESMGTKKFLELAVPISDTLEMGKTVYLDEFGAFLHPDLSSVIIALFKSEENEKGAQLILNTHNASIMENANLSRDEIILIEKGLIEESVITPLTKKSVREGESFEKRYREGLYGAVPIIRERQ